MSVLDLLAVTVVVLVISFSAILGLTVFDAVEHQLNETLTSNDAKDAVLGGTRTAIESMDYMIPFTVFGLGAAIILMAMYLHLHPAFIVISVMVLALVLIAVSELTNVFFSFAQDTQLVAAANQLTLTVQIWNNFPLIIAVIGIIAIIAMYGRWGAKKW